MIDFGRAINSAWERMVTILFRPFDLGKWFVIGFGAFLAGLLHGGNGYSGGPGGGGGSNHHSNQQHTWWQGVFPSHPVAGTGDLPGPQLALNDAWAQSMTNYNPAQLLAGLIASMSVALIILLCVFLVAFMVLLYWLGARGQFIFLDNIVRNRAAISWPWTAYARQGNSVFVFMLLYLAVLIVCILPIVGFGLFLALPLFAHETSLAVPSIIGLVLLGLVYIALILAFSLVFFFFTEFGIPLMFRHGLMFWPAFKEALRLVWRHPGSVAVFTLLRFLMFLALLFISVAACCLTCCLAGLPYLGTVVLLPVLIFIRCFTLDCLAQFGPDYDVWTVDVPPGAVPPAAPQGFSPPPPLG